MGEFCRTLRNSSGFHLEHNPHTGPVVTTEFEKMAHAHFPWSIKVVESFGKMSAAEVVHQRGMAWTTGVCRRNRGNIECRTLVFYS